MTQRKPYRVLLYYKYVHIENPEQFTAEHLDFCKSLDLKGRIIVAEEGFNGTVSGTVEQTNAYMEHVHSDERFKDMVFKIDEADGHAFKKMHVRHKKEIVTWRFEQDVNPNQLTGKRLTPQQFHEMLQRDDVIVVDGRNDYEYEVGHFRGAIRPDVSASREFPDWVRDNLAQFKDKTVLTYCTGGIRCEKFSGFLVQEGFQDVYQLDGGVVSYGQDPEVQGHLFDGKLYVFDERITVPVNMTDEATVVGRCYHCGKPEDRYINCTDDFCHRHYICCESCQQQTDGYCSVDCRNADEARKSQDTASV